MISSAILNAQSIPYLRQQEEHVSVTMGPTNHEMILMPMQEKGNIRIRRSYELVWNEIRFYSIWVDITLPWSWFKWPPSQSFLSSLFLGSSEWFMGEGSLASFFWNSCIFYTIKLKNINDKDIVSDCLDLTAIDRVLLTESCILLLSSLCLQLLVKAGWQEESCLSSSMYFSCGAQSRFVSSQPSSRSWLRSTGGSKACQVIMIDIISHELLRISSISPLSLRIT